jgi:Extensin-like protein C-terminus
MTRRLLRTFLSGSAVFGLCALAACSTGGFMGEREAWRKEAEARCIGTGAVREGPSVVRISAINGPGMCGADFPFRVTSLGVPGAMSFGDELRPPGSIPNAPRSVSPRWPIIEQPQVGGAYEPRGTSRSQVDSQPLPPPRGTSPQRYDEPISLDPTPAPARAPVYSEPTEPAPSYDLPSVREIRRPVPLGPSRGPRVAGVTGTVTVTPKATLACPMIATLDQWIATAVQPSAMHWFGQPVVEIKQISAYSCRGMNGNPRARISEHAFGNALDIASFTLADGRRITVKDGWRGAPEEQGFLRDVQGSACERFTTVLAPGSNAFHYDHMHVDLMRRSNGYRACNPRAVSGEEVAARVRTQYARQGRDPGFTGSADPRRKTTTSSKRLPPMSFADDKVGHQLPLAVPGEDGED